MDNNANSEQVNQVISVLKAIPLLQGLNDEECLRLATALEVQVFPPHYDICIQGQESDGFYIIHSGDVAVLRKIDTTVTTTVAPQKTSALARAAATRPTRVTSKLSSPRPTASKPVKSPEHQELARLGPRDYFGEAGLLSNSPRGATCRALTEVCAFYLSRTHFHQLFTSDKLKVHFARRHAIAQNSSARAPANAERTKTPAQTAILSRALADNAVFSGLSAAQRDQIVKEMHSRAVAPGTVLIKQGAVGDFLYVVERGRFNVTIGKKHVGVCAAGKLFGELALMHDAPRAATVTAEVDSLVWAIDRGTFRRVISSISAARFATLVDFVSRVPILQALSASEREKVAEALEEVKFPAGSGVCIQGEPGDCLYLVYEGSLGVFKSSGPGDRGTKVATIDAGGYVGERAILMREPRAATVVAESACTLLRLDRSGFLLLLGPIEDALRRRIEEQNAGVAAPVQEQLVQADASASASVAPGTRMAEKVPWSNLKPVSLLGKGSFGTVRLVEDTATNQTYALKSVNKARAVLMGQTRHLVLEKQCLQALSHPFIAQLWQTHRDATNVYFLTEAVLGGELFTLLRSKSIFAEDAAKFYVASVLLALEHTHSQRIIYRDLKPENVLISSKGYVKMVDFGMAKKLGPNAEGRTYTLCGTPDYLCPEVVSGSGHGKGADWWGLGVLAFELLAGYPPFYASDPMATYARILEGAVEFPAHFSREAVSLLRKFLNAKPSKRLGVVQGGARLVKLHTWFQNFDWAALEAQTMPPPHVPVVKDARDASNFDAIDEREEEAVEAVDDDPSWELEF